MKFTDSQFVEAIELIQSIDTGQKRKDKRRAPRTSIRVPIAIKLAIDSETEWSQVRLRDISPRGIRLEMDIALEIGSSFLVRLPTKDDMESAAPLICRVAHCATQRVGFLIGAEFTGRLTPAKSAGAQAEDQGRIQRSILD
jgi:hypothetical protein